jgi:hypothetical protein
MTLIGIWNLDNLTLKKSQIIFLMREKGHCRVQAMLKKVQIFLCSVHDSPFSLICAGILEQSNGALETE